MFTCKAFRFSLILTLLLGFSLGLTSLALAYDQAPMLADLVSQGKIPSLDQRLPENPLVIEPHERVGQYGGTWRRAMKGASDYWTFGRIAHEPLVAWDLDLKIQPNLVERWAFEEDGKILTLYLRKGVKWSDGAPFTADDILFQWNDIWLNENLGGALPASWTIQGKPTQLEKVDEYTIKMIFPVPYPLALGMLAAATDMYAPAHYLKQFHPAYNNEINEYNTFKEANNGVNPDKPRLSAWYVKVWNQQRMVAERNPYYWKVDTEGNQLPYIDTVVLDLIGDAEVINLKAISGELDMQGRHLTLANLPILKQNEQKGDYRVLLWKAEFGSYPIIMFNWFAKNPELQKLFRTADFRKALSLALNRDEINDLIYLGAATPRQATISSVAGEFYEEKFATAYAEYDPKRANEILDQLGLTDRNKDGFREAPDGKKLTITVTTTAEHVLTQAPELLELVKDYWARVGVDLGLNVVDRSLFNVRVTGGDFESAIWIGTGGFPLLRPMLYYPMNVSVETAFAIEYGRWYSSGGKEGLEPEGIFRELLDIYEELQVTTDEVRKVELVKRTLEIQAETLCLGIGTVGEIVQPFVVKNNMHNVPEVSLYSWTVFCPLNTKPEQYFFEK